MRLWVKWIGIIILIPVVLVLLLSVLLYIPPFQNFAVRLATRYASEATGMQIGIEQIRLSFPLDLTVQGVEVVSPPDTLLKLESLKVSIHPLPLLQKEIVVEAVDLRGVKANTGNLIEGIEIKGTLGKLYIHADRINLGLEKATLNTVDLSDAAITLLMNDTTQKADTASTPINWVLLLEKINLDRVSFAMQMPHDSLRLSTYVDKASLSGGIVDLATSRYSANKFSLSGSTFDYDGNNLDRQPGFDPSHIALSGLNAAIDSALYCGREMKAVLHELSAKDHSGLTIHSLTGRIGSDSTIINVPQLLLQTPTSEIRLLATAPWSSFAPKPEGNMRALLTASLSKEDLLLAAGPLPEPLKASYPDKYLTLTAGVEGNLAVLLLRQLKGELPGVFNIDASGEVKAVTDSINRSANLSLKARTGNLDFLLSTLAVSERERINIPTGILLTGQASLKNREYQTSFLLKQDSGTLRLSGRYNPVRLSYEADLKIDSLQPDHFLPKDSLYRITASVRAEGRGFDPFLASTWTKIDGKISDIQYGASSVSDVTLTGSLEKNLAKIDLISKYPLAEMDVSLNATLHRKEVKAMLIADVTNLDLYGMHLMKDSLATSFQLFAEAESDMGKNNLVDITLGNWVLVNPSGKYSPKTLTLHANSSKDTTRVSFHAGDLGITLTGNADLETMKNKFTRISEDVSQQLERDSMINIPAFRPLLPDMDLQITAGKDNPIYNLLQQADISFNNLNLSAYTSPEEGFRLNAGVYGLMRDTTRLDSIRFAIQQDSLGLIYNADVIKHNYRKQPSFTASVHGKIRNTYADAEFRYTDGQEHTGILLGIRADKEPDGIRLHLFPEDPIIAFRPFKLNRDNYILYKNMKDIAANLRLTGEADASLWIHSKPERGALEELHAELSQIDLDVISKAFTELPAMRGVVSADLQYAPSDSTFMIVADVNVDNLIYEDDRVGEIMFNTVYLPLGNASHQVDMHLFRDRSEVAAITALYTAGKTDHVDGSINVTGLPLEMVNPFIPDNMAKLNGKLQGVMSITGNSTKPKVGGYMELDSSSVFVAAAGSSFRFDSKKVEVKDNQIRFDNYNIYAAGTNPFVIDGNVDFNNLKRMTANFKLTANNMQLLNVKQNNQSLVYGKLFVNLNSTVKGPLDALMMRGDLQLLGGTNVTYVMKDSPLTVQDRLSDLVTFTSFADTFNMRNRRQETPLPLGGMDVLMTVHIDQSVQLNADITPDQSSRIELEGGGDLSFQYTPLGEMILNGRYTLSGGMVKYALPIIPLKEFNIQEGSYVQWTGNLMNPMLSLTATERVRASYSANNQSPRMVNFDVGIVIAQTLENLQLQFTLSAPEDMTVQNELTSMSIEDRAKIAVTMLVTGMYLDLNNLNSAGGKSNMNMGSALNSFLQSEINNIAGSALKSVDITFGVDKYDPNGNDDAGARTDYSFRFAKRFYNDRIRVVLGGRLSTDPAENSGQVQPFIDNVSVEYRLDASGTRYVKLFYDKSYESLLEGEITETGAGIVLRKKMRYLRELFIFKKNKVKPVKEEVK